MRRLLLRVRSESGQALISSLILLAGVLIPLLFLVPLFARVEQGRLAAEQAARDAVRAAVQSPSSTAAQVSAEAAVARARAQTGEELQLRLEGSSPVRASSGHACEPRSTSPASPSSGRSGALR